MPSREFAVLAVVGRARVRHARVCACVLGGASRSHAETRGRQNQHLGRATTRRGTASGAICRFRNSRLRSISSRVLRVPSGTRGREGRTVDDGERRRRRQMRLAAARRTHATGATEIAGVRESRYSVEYTAAPHLTVHAARPPKNNLVTLYRLEDRAVFHSERERHWQCREVTAQHSFTASPGPAGSKESDGTSR